MSEQSLPEQAPRRGKAAGSVLITVITVVLFTAAGLFYVKTSVPSLWNGIAECIKSVAVKGKSLETVGRAIFDKAREHEATSRPQTENPSGESGDMLLTADNLSFGGFYEPIRADRLSSTQAALPVENASVTSKFGERTDPVTGEAHAGHHGIDLAAPSGSAIRAYASGTVKEVGRNSVYGNYVLIYHGNGLETFYGHMDSVDVSGTDTVCAGDSIGIIGSTGKSTGTHLHFEVRVNGERVDPSPYLYEKI